MAGGRNVPAQRHNDSDDDTESSEDEALEELFDEFEYRLSRERRKRELQQELKKRKAAMQRLEKNLNENWDDVMKPIPASDSEDDKEMDETAEPLAKKSSIDPSNISSNSEVNNDLPANGQLIKANTMAKNPKAGRSASSDSSKLKKRKYRKSTAMLMYEWGRNQPEFQTEKDSYRAQNYKSDEVIERLAFFRFSAKHNEDRKLKTELYKKERQKEWNELKKKKMEEITAENKDDFQEWTKVEFAKRVKEDKMKRRKEVQELRNFYLGGQEDKKFEL